jgi:acetyl-CoA carboxylase biotin carboxyl carrier protein
MNLKDIEKLIKLVEDSGLSKLSVEEEGVKIELIKETQEVATYHSAPVVHQMAVSQAKVSQVTTASVVEDIAATSEVGVEQFLSPMVGTFYAAPSPDSAPFVKVGDKIKKGQSLCILEAMKLFNEIEADYNGTILEILANTHDAVEFGQPLFKIKKDA